MWEKIKQAFFGTKLGQAFDNLLKETSSDGFKSKCVVASYMSVFSIAKTVFCIAFLIVLFFAIGTFTKTDMNEDVMIEILKIVKDIFIAVATFFAIAVTTTFGATAFGIQSPGTGTKIDSGNGQAAQ